MKTQTTVPTCYVQPQTPDLSDSKPKALVRRLIQKFAPVQASIRYDVTRNLWAILDRENKPIRHFRHGFMENVSLTTISVTVGSGCGAHTNTIGVASGTLREGIYSPNLVGLSNLSFKDGFRDEHNRPLAYVSELQLLPDRRALYLA